MGFFDQLTSAIHRYIERKELELGLQESLKHLGLPKDHASLDVRSDIEGVFGTVHHKPLDRSQPAISSIRYGETTAYTKGDIQLNHHTVDILGKNGARAVINHEIGHTLSKKRGHRGEYDADFHAAVMSNDMAGVVGMLRGIGLHHPEDMQASPTHPSIPKRVAALQEAAPLVRLANIGRR